MDIVNQISSGDPRQQLRESSELSADGIYLGAEDDFDEDLEDEPDIPEDVIPQPPKANVLREMVEDMVRMSRATDIGTLILWLNNQAKGQFTAAYFELPNRKEIVIAQRGLHHLDTVIANFHRIASRYRGEPPEEILMRKGLVMIDPRFHRTLRRRLGSGTTSSPISPGQGAMPGSPPKFRGGGAITKPPSTS